MSKRHYEEMDYNEDSYSSIDDEIGDEGGPDDIIQEIEPPVVATRPRPGRPRKSSTANSEAATATSQLPMSSGAGLLTGMSTQRRRGRGPSKRPCLNRNALMARENRQKKKKYIECMEESLKQLQDENRRLKDTITKQQDSIDKLKQEVQYLHNVVSNAPEIEKLLRGINAQLGATSSADNAKSVPVPPENVIQTSTTMNGQIVTNNGQSRLLDQTPAANTAFSWNVNGLTNASNTNTLSVPLPGSTIKDITEVANEDGRRKNYGQNNTAPIARKTMPFTTFILPKPENPSSIGSSMEDDERNIVQKSSPRSGSSYCEYNTDRPDRPNSVGIDNQLPKTPMSTLSNSIGQGELTLSETDFSQISPFNAEDDLFDFQSDDVANPLQFETGAPDFINDDDTFFNTIENEINNGLTTDPNEIKEMCNSLNYKPFFSDLPNTGVCLHINSKKVTLEYCSICHLKNSEKSLKDIFI